MRTVIVGDRPPEIDEWLRLRRERGQDRFDEVWKGVYHVAPAPGRRHGQVDAELAMALLPRARAARLVASGPCNIGDPDDYRVPDQAYFGSESTAVWSPTAVLVVEVVSPDDETWAKLDFYHAHRVGEVIVADPETRTLTMLARAADAYAPVDASATLGVTRDELEAAIRWPA